VGPRAVLDAVVKGKLPSPLCESNPKTSIVHPVDYYYYYYYYYYYNVT
jgi:hypothetical protein